MPGRRRPLPTRRRPARARLGHGTTPERLLDAAERLVAERGLHGVSLREVTRAAGARNATAVHFHFGTRDGLVRAVLARRMDELSRQRIAALRQVADAAGSERPSLRAVLDAAFLPTVRLLADETGIWRRYLGFITRLAVEPSIRLHQLATPLFFESSTLVLELVKRAVPDLPAAVLAQRVLLGTELLMHWVGQTARLADGPGRHFDPVWLEQQGATILDFVAAGIAAPVRTAPTRRRARAETVAFWGLAGLPTPTSQ